MGAGRGQWLGFLTALGVKRGFFVPYRHAAEVAPPPVYKGLERNFADALAQERAAFQELRQGDEAAALRHLFFAERESAKIDGVAPDAAIDVRRIAVIGAGTMGAGIAAACLAAGYETRLIDIDAASLARGAARIADIAAQDVAKDRISADAAAERAARLIASTALADAADCECNEDNRQRLADDCAAQAKAQKRRGSRARAQRGGSKRSGLVPCPVACQWCRH